MARYQIEATVEKVAISTSGELTIRLKGYGKYCFEKKSTNEYWNIFENIEGETDFKFKKQGDQIKINIHGNEVVLPHLFSQAFIEKKKLRFELNVDSKSYTIIGISHGST